MGCGVRIRDASSATSSYTSRHTCWTGSTCKESRMRLQCTQCTHARITDLLVLLVVVGFDDIGTEDAEEVDEGRSLAIEL